MFVMSVTDVCVQFDHLFSRMSFCPLSSVELELYRVATVGSSKAQTRRLVDSRELTRMLQIPFVENLAPIMSRKLFCDFRVAFLGKFWKDEALIRPVRRNI